MSNNMFSMDFQEESESRTVLVSMGEPELMSQALTLPNVASCSALPSSIASITPMEDQKDGKIKGHRVVLTVTTVIASAKGFDEQSKLIEELSKRTKRTLDAPKPQQFFHCEYSITPTQERTVVDIISYGIAAKVFTENDSRVIKTWDDGEKIWVAWVNSHELFLTEEDILDIYGHTLVFKLWDSKYKVSDRARYDRPKAFRIPVTKGANPGKGVANLLAKQSRSWTVLQPKDAPPNIKRRDEKRRASEGPARTRHKGQPACSRVRKSIGRLAGIKVAEKKRMRDIKVQQSKILKEPNKKRMGTKCDEKPEESPYANELKKSAAESAHLRRVTVPIKLELLFSGSKEITSRLEYPSVNVDDIFVSVSVIGRLMPEELERKLNPLTIAIKSLKDLPDTPISRSRLSAICQPVYCSYKFLDLPVHKTPRLPHNKDICFEDIHVILAGMLDDGKLYEFLHSDGLAIEVHDRDRKLPGVIRPAAAVFGEDVDDSKIANLGLVSSKRLPNDAALDRQQRGDPFGITKIRLTDFLHGNTNLAFEAVVIPCPLQTQTNFSSARVGERLVGMFGSLELPQQPPLPSGDYLSSGTTLKVRLTLKYPFTSKFPSELVTSIRVLSPFGRIIYHFSYGNIELLHTLELFVTELNSAALGLDQLDRKLAEAALSTYKLSEDQKNSTTLDVITGFHIMDGESHIIVLEGLRIGAMKRLQEELGCCEPNDGRFVRRLFDTSLVFNLRLYGQLDVNLCKVRLHRSLKSILAQPLLYVRDLVPRSCFQCLIMLQNIAEANSLKDVCRKASFPTQEMVTSMSTEFGIPIANSDFQKHGIIQLEGDEKSTSTLIQDEYPKPVSVDSTNNKFDQVLNDQMKCRYRRPDFVLRNIVSVQEAGRRNRPASHLRIPANIPGSSFNHSVQALNSAEQTKIGLRKFLHEKNKASSRRLML